MWAPVKGQIVTVDGGGQWLIANYAGPLPDRRYTVRHVRTKTEIVGMGIERLAPEGKRRPAGCWDAADYLMCWEGEEYLLRITARTSDRAVGNLARGADDYATERGVTLVSRNNENLKVLGALWTLRKYREVLRSPQLYAESFTKVRAWIVEQERQRQMEWHHAPAGG